MYKKGIKNIHMVGIGGSGMNGIAEVLINLGHNVSGSDIKETKVTERLKKLGARIELGHRKENLDDAHVLVVSSAVNESNPEVVAARKRRVPVISRAEMLAELMRMKYGVLVAGSHGKTTTTSLVSQVLSKGGDPTTILGGRLKVIDSGAKLGEGEYLIAEADESDGTFLKLFPTIAVVTNIDREHLDYYKDIEEVRRTFLEFINKIPFYGLAVICGDDENLRLISPGIKKRLLSYGIRRKADLEAKEIRYEGLSSSFRVYFRGKDLGLFTLSIPGRHNIYNALAAIGVGLELEIPVTLIKESLNDFNGVERRLEIKGVRRGITVIDDYGHHPTEIIATLSALRKAFKKRRLCTIFQPHRYSRTFFLFEEFIAAFDLTNTLIITEIYPAGEKPIKGVNAKFLYQRIKQKGSPKVIFFSKKAEIVDHLLRNLRENDVVLTLGAGDIWEVGETILDRLT